MSPVDAPEDPADGDDGDRGGGEGAAIQGVETPRRGAEQQDGDGQAEQEDGGQPAQRPLGILGEERGEPVARRAVAEKLHRRPRRESPDVLDRARQLVERDAEERGKRVLARQKREEGKRSGEGAGGEEAERRERLARPPLEEAQRTRGENRPRQDEDPEVEGEEERQRAEDSGEEPEPAPPRARGGDERGERQEGRELALREERTEGEPQEERGAGPEHARAEQRPAGEREARERERRQRGAREPVGAQRRSGEAEDERVEASVRSPAVDGIRVEIGSSSREVRLRVRKHVPVLEVLEVPPGTAKHPPGGRGDQHQHDRRDDPADPAEAAGGLDRRSLGMDFGKRRVKRRTTPAREKEPEDHGGGHEQNAHAESELGAQSQAPGREGGGEDDSGQREGAAGGALPGEEAREPAPEEQRGQRKDEQEHARLGVRRRLEVVVRELPAHEPGRAAHPHREPPNDRDQRQSPQRPAQRGDGTEGSRAHRGHSTLAIRSIRLQRLRARPRRCVH